jgi:hypothetical protein
MAMAPLASGSPLTGAIYPGPRKAKPISSWHLARDIKSNVAYLHSISDGEIVIILESSSPDRTKKDRFDNNIEER